MERGRRALFAGLVGGVLAGVLDAVPTLAGAAKVMGSAGCLHLLAIEVGLGAAAGSALALVFFGSSLGLDRLLGESRWLSGAHAAALLLASPLLVHDAFALFRGPQASRIPAHGLLSVLLVLLGAAFIWAAVALWRSWLPRVEQVEGAGREDGAGRRLPLVAGIAGVLAALAVGWANRHVLPRLYPWFHLSLTLLQLVLCVLSVRLLLGTRRRGLGKRWSWFFAAAAAAALTIGVLVERPALAHSQSLRYFVFEKTHLASLFLGLFRERAHPAPRAYVTAAAHTLPPLPAGPRLPGADVVLITVDAVRADHVGCYGYGRPTTPHIDALAATGVRFERAYTQAPHTSFAIASLMVGKYYATLVRLAPSDTHETVAAILRRYGWKTAAFFPPAVFYIDAHKMKAFEAGNFDFEYVKYEFLDAEERVRQIEDFLRAENPRKLFLWLHLFEPHEPYERHPEFDFGERDVDRYDGEIAYADEVVGKVLALLRAKRPGAIVIVAADHGEEFGEHGGRYHGTTLFEEQVRVPLVVAFPGLRPHVVSGPVEVIDIPATILGLLDIPVPLRMRGTNLGPWLSSTPAPEARLPPAFAEVEDLRMVALGREKLICNMRKDYCSYFDLGADPGERQDLADRRADRVAVLRRRIDEWLAQQTRYEARLLGAADAGGELGRAIERGRLGDAGAALMLAESLLGTAALAARREAAAVLVTALPPRPETKTALLAAHGGTDDGEVRAWAAVAALRLGASEVQDEVRSLAVAPAGAATAKLPAYAALALAEKKDATGLGVLAAVLDSCGTDLVLCRRAIEALGRLGDARGVEPLVAHLPFVVTRSETVKALAAIGTSAVVGPLGACLEHDEYVSVREEAARGLGRVGGARAVQSLRRALAREREESVVAAVRAALAGRPGRR
ncbi:MAG: sulfatase-like hydrolase/transferase [Deltaproteobacteria bacterium]|nr:sulfatase-like hydrolase/transferase [Deltaproteobacteria bacterium]